MKVSSVFLLGALAVSPAIAHGDDHEMAMDMSTVEDAPSGSNSTMKSSMDMDASPMSMSHHHGRPILQNPDLEPQQRKYWEQYNTTTFFTSEEGSKFNLWMHALLIFAAFGLLGPLALVCSTDSRTQWFYVPLQTVQSATVLASLLFLAFYSATAPKLYPGNAYSGFSIALFVLVVVHWVAMITKSVTSYLNLEGYGYANANDYEAFDTQLNSVEEGEDPNAYAMDDVSSAGREASMSSTVYGSGSETDLSSVDTERHSLRKHFRKGMPSKPRTAPPSALVRKLSGNKIFAKLNSILGRFSSVIFNCLNYPLFFTGCGYMLTGLATAFLMGKNKKVFGLLAHFIKGFIFYALGFVELARFFGCGASKGWAWNEVHVRVPMVSNKSKMARALSMVWPDYPTFEFIQSFLIFFYGATNVFLEHLGNEDGVWSHKDLQHASIAFMFFGGGLCGMILESRSVKRLVFKAFRVSTENEDTAQTTRLGWSVNPMPAFIIFWTGALMSHHQQETELATQIHIQWGTMFSLGAVVRLITIALLSTKPRPASMEEAAAPQRPFTEIIVAFCLVCGGMIFMSSNRETVEGMIYRGIDQMFTLNVSVGITVLMMAYFVGCLAVKGLASLRYSD